MWNLFQLKTCLKYFLCIDTSFSIDWPIKCVTFAIHTGKLFQIAIGPKTKCSAFLHVWRCIMLLLNFGNSTELIDDLADFSQIYKIFTEIWIPGKFVLMEFQFNCSIFETQYHGTDFFKNKTLNHCNDIAVVYCQLQITSTISWSHFSLHVASKLKQIIQLNDVDMIFFINMFSYLINGSVHFTSVFKLIGALLLFAFVPFSIHTCFFVSNMMTSINNFYECRY